MLQMKTLLRYSASNIKNFREIDPDTMDDRIFQKRVLYHRTLSGMMKNHSEMLQHGNLELRIDELEKLFEAAKKCELE